MFHFICLVVLNVTLSKNTFRRDPKVAVPEAAVRALGRVGIGKFKLWLKH